MWIIFRLFMQNIHQKVYFCPQTYVLFKKTVFLSTVIHLILSFDYENCKQKTAPKMRSFYIVFVLFGSPTNAEIQAVCVPPTVVR